MTASTATISYLVLFPDHIDALFNARTAEQANDILSSLDSHRQALVLADDVRIARAWKQTGEIGSIVSFKPFSVSVSSLRDAASWILLDPSEMTFENLHQLEKASMTILLQEMPSALNQDSSQEVINEWKEGSLATRVGALFQAIRGQSNGDDTLLEYAEEMTEYAQMALDHIKDLPSTGDTYPALTLTENKFQLDCADDWGKAYPMFTGPDTVTVPTQAMNRAIGMVPKSLRNVKDA